MSSPLKLLSGVPQGSILGPLLFSLFINDLGSILQCSYHMFADDVQLYLKCKPSDITNGVFLLNQELLKVEKWVTSNGLSLNINKTQETVIYRNVLDISMFPPIMLAGQQISYSNKVKNLGIILTNTLKWDKQLNMLSSKIHFLLRRLWKFAYLTPLQTKIKLIKSLFMPHFIYCDVVFALNDAKTLAKLNVLFNACCRYVFNVPRFESVSEYDKSILGCSLTNYFKYRYCTFLHKLIITKKPEYLYEELNFSVSIRTNNINVPVFRSSHMKNSFYVNGIGLWNSLPNPLKHIQSPFVFKRACLEYFSSFE